MQVNPATINSLMQAALAEGAAAAARHEVPVGAVIAHHEQIVARAGNRVEELKDPSAHAEILCLKAAATLFGDWRLTEHILAVTLEPCTMCIGALRLARVPVIIFGAMDPRLGAVGSLYDLALDERLGGVPRVIQGVNATECGQLLSDFFQRLRNRP